MSQSFLDLLNSKSICFHEIQRLFWDNVQERNVHVDPSEATVLYKLLDMDNSGGVDAEEMVHGCFMFGGFGGFGFGAGLSAVTRGTAV